jgi:NADPH:quinone reductase-like Zn-dependent oxidoreductase
VKLRNKIGLGVLVFLFLAITSMALALSHNSACTPAPEPAAGSDVMKAIVYRCYGSPEVLQLEQVAKPVPADDEVLVKVHAAAVNPLDWHYMRGSPYVMRLVSGLGAPSNTGMGVDFAGTVEAVGEQVTAYKPGDEVFGGASGAFAEYVTVSESRALARKPSNISFEQAAAVPIAAVTALQALRDKGQLQPGQKVLVNGASGGVGTFAVQIARSMGAEVTGVCSTRNLELVRSLGANRVIDYKSEDYTSLGERYDIIVDNVGNHPLRANLAVLNPGGTLLMVGGPKGNWIGPIVKPIQSTLLAPLVDENMVTILAQITAEDLAALGELLQNGQVTSVIDRRYPLAEVPAAIAYSESGRARGKIIINVE